MPGIVLPLAEIAPLLPERGALMGLDLGTKTIGVAASDPDRRLANGVETVKRTNFSADAARLIMLAQERKAVGLVLGLPINMNGSEAAIGIARRNPDGLGAEVEPDQRSARRQQRRNLDERQDRGRHERGLSELCLRCKACG